MEEDKRKKSKSTKKHVNKEKANASTSSTTKGNKVIKINKLLKKTDDLKIKSQESSKGTVDELKISSGNYSKLQKKNKGSKKTKADSSKKSTKKLDYKVGERLSDLSKPKTVKDSKSKYDPFGVTSNAMNYTASPRIIDLAQPKRRTT